jgi:ADP-heptose:LPS heptosyltransferase
MDNDRKTKTVIISPFSQKMRNGKRNPKNYPFWTEVVNALRNNGVKTIQVGVSGEDDIGADERHNNLPLEQLAELVKSCDTWASVDNFFHHFCVVQKKPGVAVFGKSDPNIFGHPQNHNIIKDRAFLRKTQYAIWEEEEWDEKVWVHPDVICLAIFDLFR